MTTPRQIVLRDTTLREGIQVPGCRIDRDRQRRFVGFLDEIGVPEIEIGLPGGMSACADLADFIRRENHAIRASALIPCYAATWRRQVDLAAEHGLARIDVLAPVSDHLLKDADHYGMEAGEISGRLEDVLAYARRGPLEVGVGLIDACRTPLGRITPLAEALPAMGASRLVLYDSVGTMLPWEMTAFVAEIRQSCGLPILVHCHNDHGLATANSLAAVAGGAAAVDVAVNGLGGRAGNAPLEEVAVALENLCGLQTGIDTTRLRALAAFTERMTGLKNSPLKPIVGDYCFAHLPVMHVRCIGGGNPAAFEPFDPAQVGAERTYGFSLPVDYAPAVEPFLRKAGFAVDGEDIPALVAALRDNSGPAGRTEKDILKCIRDFKSATAP